MLSQIQGHFLYNTLTAINHLCVGNTKARKAITTFAKYLRGNLDALGQSQLVHFSVELEHTKQYLWLEQLRFEDEVQVVYEIESGDFLLPVLTVEPIVENAVRHGLCEKENGGTVTIRTEESDFAYHVIISDDGVGFDMELPPESSGHKDDRSHVGIRNVRQRLMAMCGGTLTIDSTVGVGTVATIMIPKERGSQA